MAKRKRKNKNKRSLSKSRRQASSNFGQHEMHPFERVHEYGYRVLAAQEWGAAAVAFKKALELKPADLSSMVNLATALMRLGRLKDAAMYAKQAITQSQSVTELCLVCAMTLIEVGEFDAARDALDAFIEQDGDSRLAFALKAQLACCEGKPNDVIFFTEIAKSKKGLYDPNLYVLAAEAYLQRGEVEMALREYELVIEMIGTPSASVVGENPIVTSWKGKASIHLTKATDGKDRSQFTMARDAFAAAVAVDPQNVPALGGLAATSVFLHRFRDALKYADAALQISITPAIALERAKALSNLGRGQEAAAIFDKLVNGDDEELRLEALGEIPLNYLRLHRFDEALAACVMAEQSGFTGPVEKNARAAALIGMGKHKEAWAVIRDAVELFPHDTVLKANAANFAYTLGREDEAVETLSEVLRSNPGYPDIWALKHNMLLKKGDESGARATAAAAQHQFKDNPELLRELESALRRDLTAALFELRGSIGVRPPAALVGDGNEATKGNRMDVRRCDVVFVTALSVEYKAVLHHVSGAEELVHPQGTIYETGTIQGGARLIRVAVALVGAGNDVAARETERALSYLNPSMALFVGVAGGLKDVDIGDIVVAEKVYGFESGKSEKEFKTRDNQYRPGYAALQRARHEAGRNDWKSELGDSCEAGVFVGAIAAGDKVVASTKSWVASLLRTSYSDSLAVEMEARGFLAGAYAHPTVQALVIRGISDLIDGKAAADAGGSQESASANASAFAVHVAKKLADWFGDSKGATPEQSPELSTDGACNLRAIDTLSARINSEWVQDWEAWQLNHLNYVRAETLKKFEEYVAAAVRPESELINTGLKKLHDTFVNVLRDFLAKTARVLSPANAMAEKVEMYVINAKASDRTDNYDERYESEIRIVKDSTRRVAEAWRPFATAAHRFKVAHGTRDMS